MQIQFKPKVVARLDRVMAQARQISREYQVVASAERPVSTLKTDPRFSNPAFIRSLDMKSGFMFLYNNRVKNSRWAWAAFTTAVVFPHLVQRVPSGRDRAPFNKMINKLAEFWTESGTSNLVRIWKQSEAFRVQVPVFTMSQSASSNTLNGLRELFCGPTPEGTSADPSVPLTPAVTSDAVVEATHTQSIESLRDAGGIFKTAYLAALKRLPNGQVTIAQVGDQLVTFLEFDVTSHQAEYLCQTPWMQIRPIDFYGLIRDWIDGRLGYFRNPPKFALPLSTIASSIAGVKGEPRTNEHHLLIDENADFWYIPEESNNIGKFDSELRASLSHGDGSLCAVPVVKGATPVATPPSQPIFTDWVNLKFAYSTQDGKLTVKSLDRCHAVTETHAARFLKQKLNGGRGVNAYTMLRAIALGQGMVQLPDLKELTKSLVETIRARDNEQETEVGDLTLADLLTVETPLASKAQVWHAVKSINELASTAFETLCITYSVQTVCAVVAFAKIAEAYGQNLEATLSADRENRKAYTQQGVDKNYQGESIPFVGKGKGLMPHQVRAQNLMRGSPKFAVLAVSAGGGKTTMIITDALKEMKLGHVHRVLIMCPSHLVGQYVKEFVYFTEGRVNVIAVNSYTMHRRRHGIAGLEQLIRTAPVNSVVVTDYNIGNGKSKKIPVGYGVSPTQVFPVVEMLRKFKFDYVACDESHYLKGTTGRQNAVARLISDIPYKRLASGTIAPNSLMDLVKQVSLFDPSIFGSQADFINEYAEEVRGNKVMKWKPGAENAMMSRLKDSVVVVNAKRKEWAAFLPSLVEDTHAVNLTPKQQHVYKSILEEVTKLIEEEMGKNKALQALLTGKSEDGEDDEDVSNLDLDSLLKPYLQRLERFVISPAADPLASVMLEGDDRISPKVLKVYEIIRAHLNSNTPGKILIFCNYNQSAQTIYEMMPPDLKAQAILYTAANKAECGAEFETNANKKIMVGVEVSMNTGLNLQFCSRLIRVDSVWTPGALEQGNSRIGRPNIKVKEERKKIFIDWVVASGTIDITKLAYLVSKRVVITKFEEAGNPLYSDERVPSPELFPMTLDVIARSNETSADELKPAFEAYEAMYKAQFQDFREYREAHPEDMNEDGSCKMTPIERAPNLANSKLMYRVPYVPGLDIYNSDQLGLVRYDQYLMQDVDDEDGDADDDDGDDEKETPAQREISKAELARVGGLWVHTEYGDGQIVGVGKKLLRVELSSGNRVAVNKLAAFVINRAQTNHADMRTLILKESGDIPFDVPYDIEVKNAVEVVLPKKKAEATDDRVHVALELTVVNDYINLEFDGAEKNPGGARALEGIGFTQPQPYMYALMRTPQHLFNLFKAWTAAGFTFDAKSNNACKGLYLRWQKQRKNAIHQYGVATDASIRSFFQIQRKSNPDPTLLFPYPMIYEDQVFIALPALGHPSTLKAISKVHVPGVKFYKADIKNQLYGTVSNLNKLDHHLALMLKRGFVITNLEDLKKERKRLQRVSPQLVEGLQTRK